MSLKRVFVFISAPMGRPYLSGCIRKHSYERGSASLIFLGASSIQLDDCASIQLRTLAALRMAPEAKLRFPPFLSKKVAQKRSCTKARPPSFPGCSASISISFAESASSASGSASVELAQSDSKRVHSSLAALDDARPRSRVSREGRHDLYEGEPMAPIDFSFGFSRPGCCRNRLQLGRCGGPKWKEYL
jgi:hypothetical protein